MDGRSAGVLGPAIGGAAGALVLLALLTAGIVHFVHRKRQSAGSSHVQPEIDTLGAPSVEPHAAVYAPRAHTLNAASAVRPAYLLPVPWAHSGCFLDPKLH